MSTAFNCLRCRASKKSRLVAVLHSDWQTLLCNACYGRLLSIWEIKAGGLVTDERAAELARLLSTLASQAEVEEASRAITSRDARAASLSDPALTMLATADVVGAALGTRTATELDWSAAVIGLCKAVEVETGRLIVEPLRTATQGLDLSQDLTDQNLRRVARYCRAGGQPPELGAVARFAGSIHAAPHNGSSPLITALRALASSWPNADWLFTRDGFSSIVLRLTRSYRNPAAHTNVLGQADYEACHDLVSGPQGVLWELISAVTPHRKVKKSTNSSEQVSVGDGALQ